MLELSRATLRPGHTPRLPISCGAWVSSGPGGQEKGSGLFVAGEAQGCMMVGVSESSSVLGRDAQCANPNGIADVARGTLPMPGFESLEEAVVGGTMTMGWVH